MKFLVMMLVGLSLLYATVNINSADKDELMSLKGIGEKKAEAIIEYRSTNCFKSIEEIANLKGIGEKFIIKNKDNINLGECKH